MVRAMKVVIAIKENEVNLFSYGKDMKTLHLSKV